MDANARRVSFSHTKDDWCTPAYVYDPLHAEFGFQLDAAASADNTKCPYFLTQKVDALSVDWSTASKLPGDQIASGAVFCNPPYGRKVGRWVAKARRTAMAGRAVVMLLPARVGTRWWMNDVWDCGTHAQYPGVQVRF